MSIEHKKDTDTTILADKLTSAWSRFKQGKLISYRLMAFLLVVGMTIGLVIYLQSEKRIGASRIWSELESASKLSNLEEFSKNNRLDADSLPSKVADLQTARFLLGPDGLDHLMTRNSVDRKKTIENIEKAKEILTRLCKQFPNDPILRAECYLGLAKAEGALIGVTKEGSMDFLGSTSKMADWLDKLAEAAPGTEWSEYAKKRSAQLRSSDSADEFKRVQTSMYSLSTPALPPGFPSGAGFGDFPSTPIPGFPGSPR